MIILFFEKEEVILLLFPIILEDGKDRERKISATVQLNRTFWKPCAR